MLDLTDTFAALGAFVRADTALTNFADVDLNLLDGGVRLRSLPNLASGLQALDDEQLAQAFGRDAATQLAWNAQQCRATKQGLRGDCEKWLIKLANTELRASATIGEAIEALADEMNAQSESIAENDVDCDEVASDLENTGDALVYGTNERVGLLGVRTPSQRTANTIFNLVCTRDSKTPNVAIGDEHWQAISSRGVQTNLRTIAQTSGATQHPRNLCIDGCFTDWESSAPIHWALSGATPLVIEETSETRFHASALQIAGTGEVIISQALSERAIPIVGGGMFSLALSAYSNGVVAGDISIALMLNGSALDGVIVIDGVTEEDEWLHLQTFVPVPRLLASDVLEIEIETASDFNGDVIIDGVSVAAATEIGNGLSIAVIQGVDEALLGDRFTLSTTSDDASPFGTYLRDAFNAEIPTDATPTIDSALGQ